VQTGVQFARPVSVVGGFGRGEVALDLPQFDVAIQHKLDCLHLERRRLLRHRCDAPSGGHFAITVVGVQFPTQQGEQARLAAAVRAHQSHPPAGMNLQVGVFDQAPRAARQREVAKLDHKTGGRWILGPP